MTNRSVFTQGEASLHRHKKKECFGWQRSHQENEILLFHKKEQTMHTITWMDLEGLHSVEFHL